MNWIYWMGCLVFSHSSRGRDLRHEDTKKKARRLGGL
jgi:hypothetical protein